MHPIEVAALCRLLSYIPEVDDGDEQLEQAGDGVQNQNGAHGDVLGADGGQCLAPGVTAASPTAAAAGGQQTGRHSVGTAGLLPATRPREGEKSGVEGGEGDAEDGEDGLGKRRGEKSV